MIASEIGMEHLLQVAAQEGIDMPALASLPLPPDPVDEVTAVQPKFPIDGLVLLAVNTTTDSGNKDDGKVNKESLRCDLGKFPLKPGSHDGSWSKETRMLLQARMAAYNSDSPKVFALQHGFHWAWLQVLGLKKDMSLISDDMSQPIELDNGSTLPLYTWPSDNAFPDNSTFGYPTHDLSFIVEGMLAEFPYLKRMEDFPYPLRYKCKSGTSDIKPKFGMYYRVPAHKECGLPVSMLGIIQGSIHSEGVCAIYAQEVRDVVGSFHWTTTKTCMWCNKAFSNGESAMNHMHAHYQITLVCPFCGMPGSHSYSSMREHMKKCKETYQDLLEGSNAETGLYKPCFCKGDMHLPKKGLAPPTHFTYKLEEGTVNTKTIKQLISEFHTRAEKEVTAVCKAHLLHKRQNAQAPDDDPKKSLCDAETDTEETPKKKQIKSIPSTTRPPPSAAVSRTPKGTGIDEVKGLDNDELDYNNDVGSEDAGDYPVWTPEPTQDEKPQDSEKPSDKQGHPSGDWSARHPGDSHPDCKKSRGRSRIQKLVTLWVLQLPSS